MNQEKQRIAIAEACGWRKVRECGARYERGELGHVHGIFDLPDYLNSLDAIHEAEIWLAEHSNGTFANDYPMVLEHIVDPDHPLLGSRADPDRFDLYCATASQRAEAFLKTLGLWEEE